MNQSSIYGEKEHGKRQIQANKRFDEIARTRLNETAFQDQKKSAINNRIDLAIFKNKLIKCQCFV